MFSVNLRHIESVLETATAATGPVLNLARVEEGMADNIKLLNLEPNVVEEWRMAINENRFNCMQILDLTQEEEQVPY